MPRFDRWVAALTLLATVGTAHADFTGPTPLAWRWTQPTGTPPLGEPLVDGNTVFVAVGGRMYALDKEAGTLLWRYPAGEPMQANFRSGAVLAEGLLIAAADNRLIYAVDARTGEARWQHAATDPVLGTPIVIGGQVVFAMGNGTLMAIRVSDGSPSWREPQRVPDGLMGTIGAHAGSILAFTQTFEMIAIDAVTTRVNWRTRFAVLGADVRPVVFGDQIFVNTGDFLSCLSALNGRQRWSVNVRAPLMRNPAVAATGIFVATREGRGFLFDLNGRPMNRPALASDQPAPAPGQMPLQRNEVNLGSAPFVDPRIFGGYVAVPTANGALNVLDLRAQKLVWSYFARPLVRPRIGDATTPDFVQAASPPVLAGNTLLYLTRDGSVFAFDPDTGVDLTPPEAQMLFPGSGAQVNGQAGLELIWLVSDEGAGVNPGTVNVTIDGALAESRLTPEGFLIVRIGGFTRNAPLTDGRKALVVTAHDWIGNELKGTYTLTIDNTLAPITRPGATPRPRPGAGGGGGMGPDQ